MKNGDWRINRSPSMTAAGKKDQYERIKGLIFNKLGNICRCGFADRRALQIDHIDGSGSLERRTRTGTSYLYHVLKHLEKYQILCANCNWIKRAERNEN